MRILTLANGRCSRREGSGRLRQGARSRVKDAPTSRSSWLSRFRRCMRRRAARNKNIGVSAQISTGERGGVHRETPRHDQGSRRVRIGHSERGDVLRERQVVNRKAPRRSPPAEPIVCIARTRRSGSATGHACGARSPDQEDSGLAPTFVSRTSRSGHRHRATARRRPARARHPGGSRWFGRGDDRCH